MGSSVDLRARFSLCSLLFRVVVLALAFVTRFGIEFIGFDLRRVQELIDLLLNQIIMKAAVLQMPCSSLPCIP